MGNISMITFSIIRKSQLEGAMRIDAEYYQPEYLEMNNKLVSHKNVLPLFELVNIKTGPAYSSDEIGKGFEIPLARIGDVTNKNEVESWLKLSESEFNKFNGAKINSGDILMTMTGDPPDVGKVNFINSKSGKILAFNQRVAKLHSKSAKISNKYLFAYLSNEFSRFQVERAALGIRQRNLGIEDLKNILVVIPDNAKIIENLIDEYLKELENSKLSNQKAENLLLEELGLKDFDFEKISSSIINFSDIMEAQRIDAEYFQPKYEKLISKIKDKNYKILPEIIKNVPAIFNPISKPMDNFKYVELSNVDASIGIIDGFSEVLGKDAPGRAKRILKAGDVIVSSVEGSLEKVALVDKEQEGHLASTGFFQLRSDKILPEVLLVIARSIIFQMQLEKQCAGTILTAVPKEAIKNVIVPILPKETQQKIADLVRQSHEARKKAKELLEEAKRKVEKMIEKN